MSKTTRSLENARPETLLKRAVSAKEKNIEKKPPEALQKKAAGRNSRTSSTQNVSNSGKNMSANREQTASAKSTPTATVQTSQIIDQVSNNEDASSQLLRRTKTTASALTQFEKGIEAIHRKDFKKAIAELQSLIEKYPNEAEIAVRARSYLDICRRGEARQKKSPITHDQSYAMGVLEHNRNNYDKAIACFQQSLERHPRADYIYYSIAAAMALKGDVSKAIENLRQAMKLNDDSRVHAKNDPDFAALESNKEFQELIGISVPRYGSAD
ncbi:MAG: tetratricopeptide repeat protein [Acidobacteriota bacterium]|jgi:tetratricopeptide (TPR) repeat protein|nr:tetratricopeptide repeat protein [Acidobacteriota bacterium]